MRDSAGPYRLANTVFILKMAVGRLVIQMTNLVRTSLLVLQKGHHGNPTGCTPPAPPPSPSHHHTPSPSCQRGTPPPAPLMANSHPPDEHRPPVLAYVHLKRETTTGQQRSNQTISDISNTLSNTHVINCSSLTSVCVCALEAMSGLDWGKGGINAFEHTSFS